MIPYGEELQENLKAEATKRAALIEALAEIVKSRGSTTRDVKEALSAARAASLPEEHLREGYAKLRKKKLEFISSSLRAALAGGKVTLAVGLWQRGVALRVSEERNGRDWLEGSLDALAGSADIDRVIQIPGEITADRSCGHFGSRDWRQNPSYILCSRPSSTRSSYGEEGSQPTRVTIAVTEADEAVGNLAVHVVRNSEEASAAGCGNLLVPGFEVLASSSEDDDISDLTVEMPTDTDERPLFIVVSCAKREVGHFVLLVDPSSPVDITEIPKALKTFWKFTQTFDVGWENKRPLATAMGGGRKKMAPTLSWYRNPQFRVSLRAAGPPGPLPLALEDAAGERSGAGEAARRDSSSRLRRSRSSVTQPFALPQRRSSQRRSSQRNSDTEDAVRQLQQKVEADRVARMARLKEVFEQCDKGKDGSINKRELIKACRGAADLAAFFELPEQIRQEDGSRDLLEELWQKLDGDGDRNVSWEELYALYEEHAAAPDLKFRGVEFDEPQTSLMLAVLIPLEPGTTMAAVNIVENREDSPPTWKGLIAENPGYHSVLASSGHPGEIYSAASEIGAVCELTGEGDEVIVIPSLQTTKLVGKFKLVILSSEAITVQRVN